MKKVFLITALLALGALSLTGCGAQSNRKPTNDEPAAARQTEIRTTETDETPDATPDDGSNGNVPENCPDGCPDGCPERKPHKGHRHHGGIVFEFIFHAPSHGHCHKPAPEESPEGEEPEAEQTTGVKRDRLAPRPRMPKKLPDDRQLTPEPLGGN